MSDNDTITELQMKISFLEDTVEKLSKEFYDQQNEIAKLQRNSLQLVEKLRSIESHSEGGDSGHEKPPHY